MTIGPSIRVMTSGDVDAVVDVHMEAFPGFFLTFLGRRFLRQLYLGIVSDPAGIAFICEDSGRCAGFVAGTDAPARFYSRLLRRRVMPFALAAALPVLRRPSILGRVLRAFSKPEQAAIGGTGRAELMSLAVTPRFRKLGTGASLVGEFIEESRRRGAEAVFLTTDAEGNEVVNQFYGRLQFVLARQFRTREGRLMNEYEKTLR